MISKPMRLSLEPDRLSAYVQNQLNNIFPDGNGVGVIADHVRPALDRLKVCIGHVRAKYFRDNGVSTFNHLNGDQYAMFLYLLANTIYRAEGHSPVCEKLFNLNKTLHGLDCFYSIELPRIFLFCHPVGSVLGRAKYGDFLLVYQNCTVGANHDTYPEIGRVVALYKGASVIGRSRIGDFCKIAADSSVLDEDVPDHSIYIGRRGNSRTKPALQPDSVWDPEMMNDWLAGS
jgi:serine O-acetyltransferase